MLKNCAYLELHLYHVCFRVALETIDRLTDALDLTDYASRIIHPLTRTLDTTPELQNTAMDTLCALIYQLGQKFLIFVPMTNKIITKRRILHQRYNILMCRILKVRNTIVWPQTLLFFVFLHFLLMKGHKS